MPNSSEHQSVNEKASSNIAITVATDAGVGLGPSDLDTLTLILYEEYTGGIINSVNGTNIKNTGRGALSTAGALVITFLPDDNQCVTTKEREVHVALIQGTYSSATKAFKHIARFTVLNLLKVS